MSNKRICKYQVQVKDSFSIEMPRNAHILDVQLQQEVPYIWAMVDTDEEVETRNFKVIGTGNPIPEFSKGYGYIGTFQLSGGSLVFHLLEV